MRDRSVEAFKRANYFIQQVYWLHSRFPAGVYADVPDLCKAVTRQEIADNDGSLTPGRYVGVAVGVQDEDAGEVFVARMREIHTELNKLLSSLSACRIPLRSGSNDLGKSLYW